MIHLRVTIPDPLLCVLEEYNHAKSSFPACARNHVGSGVLPLVDAGAQHCLWRVILVRRCVRVRNGKV